MNEKLREKKEKKKRETRPTNYIQAVILQNLFTQQICRIYDLYLNLTEINSRKILSQITSMSLFHNFNCYQ